MDCYFIRQNEEREDTSRWRPIKGSVAETDVKCLLVRNYVLIADIKLFSLCQRLSHPVSQKWFNVSCRTAASLISFLDCVYNSWHFKCFLIQYQYLRGFVDLIILLSLVYVFAQRVKNQRHTVKGTGIVQERKPRGPLNINSKNYKQTKTKNMLNQKKGNKTFLRNKKQTIKQKKVFNRCTLSKRWEGKCNSFKTYHIVNTVTSIFWSLNIGLNTNPWLKLSFLWSPRMRWSGKSQIIEVHPDFLVWSSIILVKLQTEQGLCPLLWSPLQLH